MRSYQFGRDGDGEDGDHYDHKAAHYFTMVPLTMSFKTPSGSDIALRVMGCYEPDIKRSAYGGDW